MRRRLLLLVSVPALVLAACAPVAPPAPPQPPLPLYNWQPSGPIAQGPSTQCKNVLLVGDSLMLQAAAQVAAMYQDYGYCVNVDNEAVIGSAPAFLSSPGFPSVGTWTNGLQQLLTQTHPDAVIAFFQGNGSPAGPADVILNDNEAETLNMIDVAARHNVPMFWTYPMLSAFGCNTWTAPFTTNGYEAYRQWVFTQLPQLRPNVVRVNANVLTPGSGPTQRGPATYNDSLRFVTGVQAVRAPDCIHLGGAGPSVVAYEIAFATQGLWGGVSASGVTPVAPPQSAPNIPVPQSP